MKHHNFSCRLVKRILIVSMLAIMPVKIPIAHAESHVVIGEVAWAGSSSSLADEWIELWNLGDEDISLAGFSIQGADSKPIYFPSDAVIGAKKTYIVSNYSDTDPKSVLSVAPNLVTSTIAISNSSLSLSLLDNNGNVVDQVGNGATPPAGMTGSIKASMIRLNEIWMTATESIGFDEGSSDMGTPGLCDGCTFNLKAAPEEILKVEPLLIVEDASPTSTSSDISQNTEIVLEAPATIDTAQIQPSSETSSTLASIDVVASSTADEMQQQIETTSSATTTSTESVTSTSEVPISFLSESSDSLSSVFVSSAETSTTTDTATTTLAEIANTSTAQTTPRYDLIRLNEVQPQPETGNEWIELTLIDPQNSIPLEGIQIKDRVGVIFTVATGTLSAANPFHIITLLSAKLNNDGDDVTLVDPQGNVIDTFTYDKSTKNMTWSRYPDGNGAWEIKEPTPSTKNKPLAPPSTLEPTTAQMTTTPIQTQAAAVQQNNNATALATPTSSQTNKSPVAKTTATSTSVAKNKSVSDKTTSKTTATKIPQPNPTAAPKKTAAKTTKAASTPKTSTKSLPLKISMNMTHEESYGGIRVQLDGIVGSPPGMVAGHGFILNSSDGRGLLVRVPTSKKLPEMGTKLMITGTLVFQDNGSPYLIIGTKDGWEMQSGQTESIIPRSVDLMTPAIEDVWSLIAVTGTVRGISGQTVKLDYADGSVDVAFKSTTNYRVSRLKIGDTISVLGLLDTPRETSRIFPRQTEDVTIVSHAKIEPAKSSPSTLPGWTPLGAAGLAIAGTEGMKHTRERRKRRALEKILEREVQAV
jgi:hypothetical protein